MNATYIYEGMLYAPARRSRWQFWLPKTVLIGQYQQIGNVVSVYLYSGHCFICEAANWSSGVAAFRAQMQHQENTRMRRWLDRIGVAR